MDMRVDERAGRPSLAEPVCRAPEGRGGSPACTAPFRTVRADRSYQVPARKPREADPAAEEAAARLEGRHGYRLAKRAFDAAFSAVVLVVLSPLMALVALAVKLDGTGGPALFRQVRVGKGGREFEMYKFRTMVPGAEKRLGELKALNEKTGPVFKIRDDLRVTRVGRLLRRTSLDELPQFLNVLKGDIPLRILKTRPEFSEKSMGAFALPAKSSTNKEKAFSQVVSCFANGLRMRRISLLNCNCIGGMETQFLAKPVFGVSPVRLGTLFQKSNNGLAKAAW